MYCSFILLAPLIWNKYRNLFFVKPVNCQSMSIIMYSIICICVHTVLKTPKHYSFIFIKIMYVLPRKACGSSAVCQRGFLNYDIWGSGFGKAPRGWRHADVKPGCQGSTAPKTFQQRGPGYLGYCDSGNSPRRLLNPGIRTSCSLIVFSSAYIGRVSCFLGANVSFPTW